MSERDPSNREREPKRADAEELAELVYFTYIDQWVAGNSSFTNALDRIGHYLSFRAQQDAEMGHLLVNTFESFRDPQPELEKLEPLQGMQEQANHIRRELGLPERPLPTEIPPLLTEPWTPLQ